MTLLSKIPGVSSGLNFVKNKFRLFVEYVMIALIITLLGTCFTIYIKKLQTDIKLGKVTTKAEFLDDANETNLRTIAELRKETETNNRIVADLIKRNHEIQTRYFVADQKVNSLEASDEQIKDYLNTTVPAPLQCLLNADCIPDNKDGNDQAAPTGSVVASH